ncbi:hypothetical protein LINPERPRIM_LOCUS637 [Linum perenne]
MGDLYFPAGQRCICSHWSCFFVCFQRCNHS